LEDGCNERVQPRVAPRRKPAPGTTPATRAAETAGRRSSESAPTPGLFYERRKIARWAPSEADVIRTGRAATAALPLWAMTTMESLMAHSASPSVHLHTRNVEVRSLPRTLRVCFTLLSCTASRIPPARPPALARSLAPSLAPSPAGLARLPSFRRGRTPRMVCLHVAFRAGHLPNGSAAAQRRRPALHARNPPTPCVAREGPHRGRHLICPHHSSTGT
jgi:hypothetical protein